jgi:hypothetical protein
MSAVSTGRYLGWLLRVNRRFGQEDALRSGRSFARAFHGVNGARALAPSQVTRWESGQLTPGRAVIRRYEQMLGVAPESLVTAADSVMRSAGDVLHGDHRADPDHSRERLYHFLDRVLAADAMTGADWSTLTELTIARPHLELYPPKLWQDTADRLLHELVASTGNEWLLRQEAMTRLFRHPSARSHAVAACIAMAGDASSPAVIEPLSLLDTISDPVANGYVVRQIEHPEDERALQGALRAALSKVTRGHLQPPESKQLVASISGLLSDPTLDGTILPLVVKVARKLAQRPAYADQLARHLPAAPVARQVWTAGRVADSTAAQAVSARIAARAQSRLPYQPDAADGVLAALVEESLFVPDPDRSLVANTLIAATPYRVPFAYALFDELKADLAHRSGICPLAAGLSALTRVGVDIHRPMINEILTGAGFDAAARYAAAWATPYCAGRYTEHAWRQIFSTQLAAWRQSPFPLGESILKGITYGIGTDGHRDLLTDIRDHPFTPPSAQTMASWLLQTT